jgi:ubiquinone biosynthesis protein
MPGAAAAPALPAGRTRLADPVRLRQLLQRLGPTFIKIGQFLAMRPDLIPQEYCDELLQLVDQVPGFPWTVARRILAEDLQQPPEAVFRWIDPHPLAAGSLAQVHLARTASGEEVAVKVQREGVREAIERDLGRARLLARLLARSHLNAAVEPRETVAELGRWLHAELDYALELRNLERMHRLAARQRHMRVPRPFPELSGPRVVTAEYLPGVPFSELLALVRGGRADRIAALGFDRDALAESLLHAELTQIFRFQLFHADTHPGNLLALPGNRVGFVDFGLVESLDPTFREASLRYLAAIYGDDPEAMFHGLAELLVPSDATDLEQFRADFYEQSRIWQREREQAHPGEAGRRSPVAGYMVGVLTAARRNRLRIPVAVLAMYRALLTAETVASQLGGAADLSSVGSRFFNRLLVEQLLETFAPGNLQPLAVELRALLTEAPGQLRRLLADSADGRLELKVRTRESRQDRRHADDRARLVAAATVSVGLALLVAGAGDTRLFGRLPVAGLLAGALVAVWCWVAVLWRRLG